ncbi:Uncharacterized protein HZ326_17395 [Fusarium oxysporum f. sp. albedinis]|nr:Uncharacterized protein HZ326_17395 [Fusarium oxysporum f. sp. albedinis]
MMSFRATIIPMIPHLRQNPMLKLPFPVPRLVNIDVKLTKLVLLYFIAGPCHYSALPCRTRWNLNRLWASTRANTVFRYPLGDTAGQCQLSGVPQSNFHTTSSSELHPID